MDLDVTRPDATCLNPAKRIARSAFVSTRWAGILLVALTVSACHRRPAPPAVPAPPPPAAMRYSEAEKSFDAGDYAGAAGLYQEYLNLGAPQDRDRALFRAGLSWAFAGKTQENAGRAKAQFQRLVTQFPSSPYTAPANLVLSLMAEIDGLRGSLKEQEVRAKALAEELKRLKDIDMRRRPTSPPSR